MRCCDEQAAVRAVAVLLTAATRRGSGRRRARSRRRSVESLRGCAANGDENTMRI